MATIDNRSNSIVSMRNRDDLTRSFLHDKTKRAQAYLAMLAQQGFRPQLQQLDDKFFVRIRNKGYLQAAPGVCVGVYFSWPLVRLISLLFSRSYGLAIKFLGGRIPPASCRQEAACFV